MDLRKRSNEYLKTREEGKKTRKKLTSAIKIFSEYARLQGCKFDDKFFYRAISAGCNVAAGLKRENDRDNACINRLKKIDLLENMINEILNEGMAKNINYTQIWVEVKKQIEAFFE